MTPLAGCRVLDLGIITAGAATSALLADLGAEVIKVESPAYRDPFRNWLSGPAPSPGDDLPPFFSMTNRGKLSLGLDLKTPAGRDVFLRLARHSDIVVENFSRGVMARLGLGFPALLEARPGIILASISSQGETGPDAAYVSFGSTLEAASGMAWMTGYPGGPPVVSGIDLNYPDQIVALFAAGLIAATWRDRKAGGVGVHLDLSQRELTSFLVGEAFSTDVADPRRGNGQAPYAAQHCVHCADGVWVAVSVAPDQVGTVAALVGATPGGLMDTLSAWAAAQPAEACVARLLAAGVAAACVADGVGCLRGMGGVWRDAMRELPGGSMVKGTPFRFGEQPVPLGDPARPLGTDSADILRRVGGFGDADIAALVEAGIVHTGAAAP